MHGNVNVKKNFLYHKCMDVSVVYIPNQTKNKHFRDSTCSLPQLKENGKTPNNFNQQSKLF